MSEAVDLAIYLVRERLLSAVALGQVLADWESAGRPPLHRMLADGGQLELPRLGEALAAQGLALTDCAACRQQQVRPASEDGPCPSCGGAVEPVALASAALERVGRYRLERLLGSGGMGKVYLGRDPGGQALAIKVLRPDLAGPAGLARFAREGQLLAGLRHPNLVEVIACELEADPPHLAMQLVRGQTFTQLLAEGASVKRGLAVLRMAAAGVGAIHAAGIVHRDLKPDNVLIDEQGLARVTDFGLVRRIDSQSLVTRRGEAVGTPAYMAPEVIQGAEQIGPACDVYALGVMLYRVLVGEHPFSGRGAVAVWQAAVDEGVPAPSERVPQVPPELDRLCLRATDRDPARRPADGEAFAAALDRAVLDSSRPPSATSTAIGAVVGLALTLLIGLVVMRDRQPGPGEPVSSPSPNSVPFSPPPSSPASSLASVSSASSAVSSPASSPASSPVSSKPASSSQPSSRPAPSSASSSSAVASRSGPLALPGGRLLGAIGEVALVADDRAVIGVPLDGGRGWRAAVPRDYRAELIGGQLLLLGRREQRAVAIALAADSGRVRWRLGLDGPALTRLQADSPDRQRLLAQRGDRLHEVDGEGRLRGDGLELGGATDLMRRGGMLAVLREARVELFEASTGLRIAYASVPRSLRPPARVWLARSRSAVLVVGGPDGQRQVGIWDLQDKQLQLRWQLRCPLEGASWALAGRMIFCWTTARGFRLGQRRPGGQRGQLGWTPTTIHSGQHRDRLELLVGMGGRTAWFSLADPDTPARPRPARLPGDPLAIAPWRGQLAVLTRGQLSFLSPGRDRSPPTTRAVDSATSDLLATDAGLLLLVAGRPQRSP